MAITEKTSDNTCLKNPNGNGYIMKDGSIAFLNSIGNFYIRHEKKVLEQITNNIKRQIFSLFKSREDFQKNYDAGTDRTVFYSLEGYRIRLPVVQCTRCGDMLEPRRLGHYIACKCGDTFVDVSRSDPSCYRCGGSTPYDPPKKLVF